MVSWVKFARITEIMTDIHQNLTNHFLLASPHIDDGIFQQSLIYICRTDKQGTLGLVLNKPITETNLLSLFENLDIAVTMPDFHKKLPLAGGPMNPEVGFVLHTGQPVWASSFVITENVCITTSRDVLHSIASGNAVRHFELCLGHSSWVAGQLENEIARGDWIVLPADLSIIFDTKAEHRWQKVVDLLGIDFDKFTMEMGHA